MSTYQYTETLTKGQQAKLNIILVDHPEAIVVRTNSESSWVTAHKRFGQCRVIGYTTYHHATVATWAPCDLEYFKEEAERIMASGIKWVTNRQLV